MDDHETLDPVEQERERCRNIVAMGERFNQTKFAAEHVRKGFGDILLIEDLNFKLPPAYRTRLPVLIGGVTSAVVLSVFAVISGWGLVMKLATVWLGGG